MPWLIRMANMPGFDARHVRDLLELAAVAEELPAELRDQARAAWAEAHE
ncbi:hypothetical protein [Amycolatopsis sp. NPDC051372]